MKPFSIGDIDVQPGRRASVDLPVSTLSNHTHVTLPVHVVHGEAPGPTMFLSGAIHGDEIQ
ncbi:MAG TPA: succinylglutamate desuccinylase, partial [Aestuariivirga sp.]|nr:succinylglutamate desuccinylase [Aestuariivirga sp.]